MHQSLNNLCFYSDKNKAQRNFMTHLRCEIRHRRENGELDLIIKYVKVTPVIMNSKKIINISSTQF